MQNQMQFHGQQSHNNGNPALLNLLPNSGHQTDLNHLWTQLQELSQLLSINRESAAKLVQKADEAKVRATPEEGSTHLRDAQQESKAENEDLSSLVNDYESVLEKVLEGLRIFIHEQSISTINIHQSYASQLAIERQVNADLRQEAAEFQARLAKLGAFLRMAHENESSLGPDVLIEELKAENMALRDALGMKLKEM
ncbi:hypothetical protein TWF788_001704 [Orbilia oligospora]|uniref:Uncharacterized protein n=1 Tax=Orbilia oligospora TaxID=2813651 RepID=A0A7C8K400_ORBOL|nr:hypothetical protein TWF788_001704 [Orbilia oligospora]